MVLQNSERSQQSRNSEISNASLLARLVGSSDQNRSVPNQGGTAGPIGQGIPTQMNNQLGLHMGNNTLQRETTTANSPRSSMGNMNQNNILARNILVNQFQQLAQSITPLM